MHVPIDGVRRVEDIGPVETGDGPSTTASKGYWDRLARQARPTTSDVATGPPARSDDHAFVVAKQSSEVGYVCLLVAVLVLAAVVDRSGSRWYFVGVAALVLLGAASLYRWRSQFAATRVELIDGGDTLSIISPRQTTRLAVASLTGVDETASPVAQFFGWPEITLHESNARIRLGRPQDVRDFLWRLGQSNHALGTDSPRATPRPWIVAVAVGIIVLGVFSSIAFVATTAGHAGTRSIGLIVLAIGLLRLLLSIRLWAGSRRAWRTFIVLAVVGVAVGFLSTDVNVGALASEILIFAVLTSPGVRRWATD